MSKRNTKPQRRAAKRGKLAPAVVDRYDELGIAEFSFRSHGLALMPLAQLLCDCKVNDLLAGTGQALIEWLLQLSAESLAGSKSKSKVESRARLLALQLFDAPILGVLERLAAGLLPSSPAWPSRSSWTRQMARCELYSRSRRSSALNCPRSVQASASARMRRLSSALNVRRSRRSCSGLATTSVGLSGETGLGMTLSTSPSNRTYISGILCLTHFIGTEGQQHSNRVASGCWSGI